MAVVRAAGSPGALRFSLWSGTSWAALADVATDGIPLPDLWEAGRRACLPDGVTNDDVCMVLLRRTE